MLSSGYGQLYHVGKGYTLAALHYRTDTGVHIPGQLGMHSMHAGGCYLDIWMALA